MSTNNPQTMECICVTNNLQAKECIYATNNRHANVYMTILTHC